MQQKHTLLGGAAIAILVLAGSVGTADAKVKHHVMHQAAAGDSKLSALTDEVETLERRLEAEGQAREALQNQVAAAQAQAAQAQADANSARGQLAEQIQTIPGVVDSEVAKNKPKPTWADNTKVGATVYTDLSNINQSPNTSTSKATKDGTGFDIKRAYLSVDEKFSDIYSANLTIDFAPQASTQTIGGTSVNQGAEAIKYAYLQAKYSDALVVQLGAAKTPWIPYVEDIYGYRYVDKVLIDNNKLGNSSDYGINAHGGFAKGLFEYSVSVVDGQGYKNPDRSEQMDVEGRVDVNYMGFTAAVGGSTGKLAENIEFGPATRTASREDVLLAYTSKQFRIGGEYVHSQNNLTSGSQVISAAPDKADGYSVFGSYTFVPKWSLFGRYDYLKPSQSLHSGEKYDYFDLGLSYEPVKILDLALVYKHESISGAPVGGYADANATLAPLGGSGHYDEVGVFTQFKF